MQRILAVTTFVLLFGTATSDRVLAQTPPLVLTSPVPASAAPTADAGVSPIVAERALALWTGGGDFGVGVDLAVSRWTIRSIESMNVLHLNRDAHATFQQIEILSTVLASRTARVAAGGGVREEWSGTRVLIARAVAAGAVAGGRLQGSVVIEHALSSIAKRDAADMVMTAGWTRRVNTSLAIGVEGIGQDLEGFWDSGEADGGARLLAGPSVHLRSSSGAWSASATVGPVFRSSSTAPAVTAAPSGRAHQFGLFAAATWSPSSRR